mmetsp:Transcript_52358/g.147435  ORF Transcript_52358/g.147435 Transcript_52358/m.147435 type:complete len:234 (-) Transcript_52358:270-971(-)
MYTVCWLSLRLAKCLPWWLIRKNLDPTAHGVKCHLAPSHMLSVRHWASSPPLRVARSRPQCERSACQLLPRPSSLMGGVSVHVAALVRSMVMLSLLAPLSTLTARHMPCGPSSMTRWDGPSVGGRPMASTEGASAASSPGAPLPCTMGAGTSSTGRAPLITTVHFSQSPRPLDKYGVWFLSPLPKLARCSPWWLLLRKNLWDAPTTGSSSHLAPSHRPGLRQRASVLGPAAPR